MAGSAGSMIGAFASGMSQSMGSSASTAMMVGMVAMTVATVLLAPKQQKPNKSSEQYATVDFTARADNEPLPRMYGTVGLPGNLTWFGNYYFLDTKKSESKKRDY